MQSYEVKFAHDPGNNLAFSAFEPNGTGRGLAHQFMPELVNQGYYRARPMTDLEVADAVIVYKQEKVEYEDELVAVLAYEYVFYEGEYIGHDGEYVFDKDSESNQIVFWTEKPVGVGEYESATDISDDIDDIITGQNTVNNIYDERNGVPTAGQAIASTGRLVVEAGDC